MGQQSGATKSRRPYLEQGPRSAISRLTAQLALAVVFSSALGGCSGDARSATPAPAAAIEVILLLPRDCTLAHATSGCKWVASAPHPRQRVR